MASTYIWFMLPKLAFMEASVTRIADLAFLKWRNPSSFPPNFPPLCMAAPTEATFSMENSTRVCTTY